MSDSLSSSISTALELNAVGKEVTKPNAEISTTSLNPSSSLIPPETLSIRLGNFTNIICNEDADVKYCQDFIPPEYAKQWTEYLQDNITFLPVISLKKGKPTILPRLRAVYGDEGIYDNLYTRRHLTVTPWTDELRQLRDCIAKVTNQHYNFAILNLYRDAKDGVSYHADTGEACIPGSIIASMSFGAVREFRLKHVKTGETKTLHLHSGSLLLMGGNTQMNYVHAIPKTGKAEKRINLTFRLAPESLKHPKQESAAYALY